MLGQVYDLVCRVCGYSFEAMDMTIVCLHLTSYVCVCVCVCVVYMHVFVARCYVYQVITCLILVLFSTAHQLLFWNALELCLPSDHHKIYHKVSTFTSIH